MIRKRHKGQNGFRPGFPLNAEKLIPLIGMSLVFVFLHTTPPSFLNP